MNRGVPPTAANARTGEFTPPGVTAQACSNNRADAAAAVPVCPVCMATSVPAGQNVSTTGCSWCAGLEPGVVSGLDDAMQLPQWLARFNRYVTNPIQRLWAGWAPTFGILEH